MGTVSLPSALTAQVQRALDICCERLADSEPTLWAAGIPEMEWSVSQAVAHIAECCLWYAIDLAAAGQDLLAVEHRVEPERDAVELLETVQTYGTILIDVLASVPETQRGFHPFGMADPSGFAAMACDELLIHTWDAARGLSLEFEPPPEVASATLARLFPWTDSVQGEPWQVLLWANGRQGLPDRKRLSSWRWQCAPLSEWDGTDPSNQMED